MLFYSNLKKISEGQLPEIILGIQGSHLKRHSFFFLSRDFTRCFAVAVSAAAVNLRSEFASVLPPAETAGASLLCFSGQCKLLLERVSKVRWSH